MIRPKVVCVLWHSGRMLLIRATDPHDGSNFLLPPGGGVEFGEKIDDAVRREIREELGAHIPNARRLGMLESLYRFGGQTEHELVFVYEAECTDPNLVERDELQLTESNGDILQARWYSPSDVVETGLPVFPDGLTGLLNLAV